VTTVSTASVVITDTSVLINLSHTQHLSLLSELKTLRFVVPDEVIAEVEQPSQLRLLKEAVEIGAVSRVSISTPAELELFVELSRILGAGESACLALSVKRGWIVASDEKRVFLREAQARLGTGRVLNTPGLYVLWIRAGVLSVTDADAAKAVLEANRFRMAFASFRDVI
jgi:predicted nucleic acid-binding protein